jgi:hypothetical protein
MNKSPSICIALGVLALMLILFVPLPTLQRKSLTRLPGRGYD